jgi:uncharacterized protein YbaP (TraB family)
MFLKRFPVFISFILFLPIIGFAQAHKYQGLLWQISGNGLSKPSYLYGTMHVSNKLAFRLSDSFYTAIQTVDEVGLESNPATWMDQLLSTGMISSYIEQNESENNYSGDFYREAFKYPSYSPADMSAGLAGQRPLINALLFRFEPGAQDYEENTYLDLFIFQTASKMGKTVHSLEGYRQSFELYAKGIQNQNANKNEDRSKQIDFYNSGANSAELTEQAYRKGDLDMVDSITNLTSRQSFLKYFIVERNKVMAHSMDSILQSKKTLLSAVGAAHLPGKEGVIELLRQMGYTVRAVSPESSKKSGKAWTKYSEMVQPLKFNTQQISDQISIDAPGTLYRLPASENKEEYIYPDMVNGTYYYVSRQKTYGSLYNRSPKDIMMSIDTFLYELVPGKITKTEHITSSTGWQGYNVITRLGRGDYMRYNIFVSPTDVYVFSIGGNNSTLGKDANRFFSSIKFTPKATGSWQAYTPKSGGFTTMVPGAALYDGDHSHSQGIQYMQQQFMDKDSSLYIIARAGFHDFSYIEEDTFELNILADNFAKEFGLKEVNRQWISVENEPGLDVNYS